MNRTPAFTAPLSVTARSNFVVQPYSTCRPRVSHRHAANVSMVSPTNIATKTLKVEAAKEKLNSAQLVFAANLKGLSVANVYDLKNRMPESTKVMTVKNTLMKRAIQETQWAGLGDLAKDSNMWFFVGEEVKETVDAYNKFLGELKIEDGIKGGVYEGEFHDGKGIEAIAALPSKKELITTVAVLLKMVPTKMARSIKAVPTKVARAIKLAVAEDGDAAPGAE